MPRSKASSAPRSPEENAVSHRPEHWPGEQLGGEERRFRGHQQPLAGGALDLVHRDRSDEDAGCGPSVAQNLEDVLHTVLIRDRVVERCQGVFEPGPIEISLIGEHLRSRDEERSRPIRTHENQTTEVVHDAGRVLVDGYVVANDEELGQSGDQHARIDVVIQPMDGGHTELTFDELLHEGHRAFGSTRRTGICPALFVPEGATDGVAMMTVGDDHIGPGDAAGDDLNPLRVIDPFERVGHAVGFDGTQFLTGFGEDLGQTRSERQAPHRREIGQSGPGEVETIGLGFGSGSLVREHSSSTLVDHFQTSDHSSGGSGATRWIEEAHAVDGERGFGIEGQNPGLDPFPQYPGGALVTFRTVRFEGDVDVHDVVRMSVGQFGSVPFGEHVIGGCGDLGEGIGSVPERGEWFESRHSYRLSLHEADPRDRCRRKRRQRVPPSKVEAVTAVVLCDLDGVIWLAHQPIEGSVEAVARLRASGRRVLFVTNNSSATEDQQLQALADIGIRAEGDLVSSAHACGALIPPGSRVLVAGGPGLEEAVQRRGAVVLDPVEADRDEEQVQVVVVGFHRHFDFEGLRRASRAVRAGATFLASNDDATYPTPSGEIPGGGSILAAIETAAGRRAVIAGKPHRPMATAIVETLGGVDMDQVIMVGDRPSTDGRMAEVLGCRYALVRSGVTQPSWTKESHPGFFGECPVHLDRADLSAVADAVIGASG